MNLSTIIKILGFGSLVAPVAVGATATTTTVVGVAGSVVLAYEAVEAVADNDDTIISHTAPKTMLSFDNTLDGYTTTHTGTGGRPDEFQTAAVNSTFEETMVAERPHSTTAIDPQIAKALSNYHDMAGIMQNLGFIKIEDEAEFSSSHTYGCPAQSMSQTNTHGYGRR